MALRFIKLPTHKRFNYNPIYYNEMKEELDERVKNIKKEMGVNDEDINDKPLIKGHIVGQFRRNIKQKKQSNLRLVIILIALILIAYLLFFR